MKKDRILISALLFSAIWHVFWLSVFTVVVVPKNARPVKFSNISFLGPILEHGTLGVGALEPRERTILEKRYLAYLESLYYYKAPAAEEWSSCAGEEDLANLTASMIDDQKIEPGRDID